MYLCKIKMTKKLHINTKVKILNICLSKMSPSIYPSVLLGVWHKFVYKIIDYDIYHRAVCIY